MPWAASVQGREPQAAERLLEDARELEQAGAFALLLEGIPARWPSASLRLDPHGRYRRGPGLRRAGAGVLRLSRVCTPTAAAFVKHYAEVGESIVSGDARLRGPRCRPVPFRPVALFGAGPPPSRRQPTGCGRERRAGRLRPGERRMSQPGSCTTIAELTSACEASRVGGARLGFVPTMGALHAGHLAVGGGGAAPDGAAWRQHLRQPDAIRAERGLRALPAQSGSATWSCSAAGVELVFAPDASEMYPPG